MQLGVKWQEDVMMGVEDDDEHNVQMNREERADPSEKIRNRAREAGANAHTRDSEREST